MLAVCFIILFFTDEMKIFLIIEESLPTHKYNHVLAEIYRNEPFLCRIHEQQKIFLKKRKKRSKKHQRKKKRAGGGSTYSNHSFFFFFASFLCFLLQFRRLLNLSCLFEFKQQYKFLIGQYFCN